MMHILRIVLFSVLVAMDAHATVYWASPTGNNSATCSNIDSVGTADAPGSDPGSYGTIGRAAECATVAGDVVNIKAGTYTSSTNRIDTAFSGGTISLAGLKSGTSESVRTYVQGDPTGARPVIQGFRFYCTYLGASRNYITIRHLKVDEQNGGGTCSGTMGIEGHHVTVTDVELTNALDANILVGTSCISSSCTHTEAQFFTLTNSLIHHSGGDGTGYGIYITQNDGTIEHNEFHNFKGYAIHAYSDFGAVHRAIIRRNYLHDALKGSQSPVFFGCHGIVVTGANSIVSRNIIDLSTCPADSDPSSAGVTVGFSTTASAAITHNIIYKSRGYGVRIGGTPTGAQTIYNNIFFGNVGTTVSISPSFSGSALYTHNACESGATCTTSNKLAISALTQVTVSTTDFTSPSVSPAVDFGKTLSEAYNESGPDIGPFEQFNFASCEVPNGSASTIRVTFTSNLNLLGSTLTTFTARKNASSNALTGAASKIGDTIVSLPLTSTYVGGDTADVSWASGGLTDNARIGGTINQPFLQTLTNQSCTNNSASAPTYVLDQASFRYKGIYGAEASTDFRGAENLASLEVVQNGGVQLRTAVKDGTSNAPPVGLILRYARNGGAYAVIPDSYGADGIQMCGSSYSGIGVESGTSTTAQLSTSGTFIPGAVILNASAIPTIVGLNVGFKTELQHCVKWNESASGAFTFRLYEQSGTPLGSYTETPSVTIVPAEANGG